MQRRRCHTHTRVVEVGYVTGPLTEAPTSTMRSAVMCKREEGLQCMQNNMSDMVCRICTPAGPLAGHAGLSVLCTCVARSTSRPHAYVTIARLPALAPAILRAPGWPGGGSTLRRASSHRTPAAHQQRAARTCQQPLPGQLNGLPLGPSVSITWGI